MQTGCSGAGVFAGPPELLGCTGPLLDRLRRSSRRRAGCADGWRCRRAGGSAGRDGAAARANRAVSTVRSRRMRGRGGVGASVGVGEDGGAAVKLNRSRSKSGLSRSKRRPQSARRPSSRGFVNKSVIAQRISRNPSGVADGLRSGFELDKRRHGGMIERHGKYARGGGRPAFWQWKGVGLLERPRGLRTSVGSCGRGVHGTSPEATRSSKRVGATLLGYRRDEGRPKERALVPNVLGTKRGRFLVIESRLGACNWRPH